MTAPLSILFVAEAVTGSRSAQRLNALRGLGHRVVFVPPTPPGFCCEDAPSLAYRVSYRLRLPLDRAGVNAALNGIDASAFDVVLLDNAAMIRRTALIGLKRRNPRLRLVWFSEDDLMNPRHRSRWLEAAIPLFDLWVTTKSFNADPNELPRLGAKRILFVNNSFDPDLHRPVSVDESERQAFSADVSFVGTFEAPRAASLLHLARQGIACRVWGNGWGGMIGLHPNLVVRNRPVYGPDYPRVLAASAVNLCFLRHFNRDRQTTRSVEIPACGAFMLHERSEEMMALLRDGVEAAYFSDDTELTAQCRRWLADPGTRSAAAAAGRERIRALGLSHAETMARVLDAAGCPS